jgi:hypothetical protein
VALADKLKALADQKPKGILGLFASMDEESSEALRLALLDHNIPIRQIEQALKEEGFKTSRETLTAFRRATQKS